MRFSVIENTTLSLQTSSLKESHFLRDSFTLWSNVRNTKDRVELSYTYQMPCTTFETCYTKISPQRFVSPESLNIYHLHSLKHKAVFIQALYKTNLPVPLTYDGWEKIGINNLKHILMM